MCFYRLDICPYPHKDAIALSILDTNKYPRWELCDLIKPWGRLSCGNLSICHKLPLDRRTLSSSGESSNMTKDEEALPTNGVQHTHMPNIVIPLSTRVVNSPAIPSEVTSISDHTSPTNSDTRPLTSSSTASWTGVTTPNTTHDFQIDQTARCEWCTATLKEISYKSKDVQAEAHRQIEALEAAMRLSPDLQTLRKTIAHKELELDRLRASAWSMSMETTTKTENGRN